MPRATCNQKIKVSKSMEAALWESANKLRGAVEPAEYKHVVLSLIFLKYAGDRFEQRQQELNLAIRGISADIRQGDTFHNDQHKDLKADYIMANPPFNQNDKVEAIIILPRNMFYSTDISVTLWILNNNKKARVETKNGEEVHYRDREGEVLFIDLRQVGEPFEKKYIQFSPEQIRDIADTYHNWQRAGYEQTYHNEPEYCYSATRKEIEQKGYSLVPSKYIEFRNRDEQIDFEAKMRELQTDLRDLLKQEEESTKDLKDLFEKLGYKLKS